MFRRNQSFNEVAKILTQRRRCPGDVAVAHRCLISCADSLRYTTSEANQVERKTISIMKACELVGVSRRTIYNWLSSAARSNTSAPPAARSASSSTRCGATRTAPIVRRSQAMWQRLKERNQA